jgi:4'-phosphopantetheinyl transferase
MRFFMDIYGVKISNISEEKIEKLCLLIDENKRYRIEKFINKEDKIRTLIGELLLRTIIFEKLSIENKYITFEKNQYGKPYLKGHPKFQFNIAHSGDFVVCAIDSKPIGIDVEEVKDIQYKEIAESFFSASEFDYIIKEDVNVQLSKFYEIWTLKESYIKCCGQGLSIPLKSFSFDIDKCQNIKVIIENEYGEHVFKRLEIDDRYKMSICSLNSNLANEVVIISQKDLMTKFMRTVTKGD